MDRVKPGVGFKGFITDRVGALNPSDTAVIAGYDLAIAQNPTLRTLTDVSTLRRIITMALHIIVAA